MQLAATYWKTYMDRLLMMKDEERTHGTVHKDQDSVYKMLEQLINLFYRAVDAEKNDDEVRICSSFLKCCSFLECLLSFYCNCVVCIILELE